MRPGWGIRISVRQVLHLSFHVLAPADIAVSEIKIKANVATELRDSVEALCSGPSYGLFLAKLWPIFRSILEGEPVFLSTMPEQASSRCGLPQSLPDDWDLETPEYRARDPPSTPHELPRD